MNGAPSQRGQRGAAAHRTAAGFASEREEAHAPGAFRTPPTLAPATDPEPRRLATFPRSGVEELRVELATYKGKPFVQARIWFRTEAGVWHPTKRGVTFRVHELADAVGAFTLAAEELSTRQRAHQAGGGDAGGEP